MARNIDFGEDKNLIPFNCYRSSANEKGRLTRELAPYDRIYCSIENSIKTASNVNNLIRCGSEDATFRTRSDNTIEKDYYIQNVYTGEFWKVESVSKLPLNNTGYENSCRVNYETILVCGK